MDVNYQNAQDACTDNQGAAKVMLTHDNEVLPKGRKTMEESVIQTARLRISRWYKPPLLGFLLYTCRSKKG